MRNYGYFNNQSTKKLLRVLEVKKHFISLDSLLFAFNTERVDPVDLLALLTAAAVYKYFWYLNKS